MSKKLLGIDYGKKKVGLAIVELSESKSLKGIAEPLRVIRYKLEKELIRKIGQIVKKEQVEQVVLGISEGEMAKETKEFGKRLEQKLQIPVVYQDEALTTQEAQRMSIEAGIKRIKRKSLEDAYSAALILQAYVDNFS